MSNVIQNNCEQIIKRLDFSSLKNKRVLITGASGLIGIHMVSVLKELNKQHNFNTEIWCWVFSDIHPQFSSIFDGCIIVKSDITNSQKIREMGEIFAETHSGFDVIIHAAGYGQPQKFTSDKIKTIQLNTKTIVDLFQLLNHNGSFLFCSTSEIYSGVDEENIDENRIGTTSPLHPRSCYIEGKRCGEAICNSYHEQGNRVKIARISLGYGPGTKPNDARVMNNIIQKAIKNRKINLLDDGSSIRTYGYITDIVEMLFNILLHGKHFVYNVAGISKVSVLELANKVGKHLDCPVECPPSNSNGICGNPKVVNISIDRYIKEFGEKSFEDIDSGLAKTIEWQQNLYSESES